MNTTVYDLASAWRSEANALLAQNPEALDMLISRCKAAVGAQRYQFAKLEGSKLERYSRTQCQHRLMVLVPALRYAYLVKQGATRTSDPNPLATFLLATALGNRKEDLMPPRLAHHYVFRQGWPDLCVQTARELLTEHSGLFPALPDRLSGATTGLASLAGNEVRQAVAAQKAALKKRILKEMQFTAEERQLLDRVM